MFRSLESGAAVADAEREEKSVGVDIDLTELQKGPEAAKGINQDVSVPEGVLRRREEKDVQGLLQEETKKYEELLQMTQMYAELEELSRGVIVTEEELLPKPITAGIRALAGRFMQLPLYRSGNQSSVEKELENLVRKETLAAKITALHEQLGRSRDEIRRLDAQWQSMQEALESALGDQAKADEIVRMLKGMKPMPRVGEDKG